MDQSNAKYSYTAQELSLFCSQVLTLLRAGVFLPDGIEGLAQEADDSVLTSIARDTHSGINLAEAMQSTGAFPVYMVNMIDIGEKSGKLEDVLESLVAYYDREQAIKSQVKVALFYPLMHACMMIAIIAVLCIVVLPVFAEVFMDLGGAAGLAAPSMLVAGEVIGYVSLVLTVAVAGLALTAFFMMRSKEGFENLINALAKIKPIRPTIEKISMGRFSFALSLLLSSGYSLDGAFQIVPSVITNKVVGERIQQCAADVKEGKPFLEALKSAKLFSGLYLRILGVGMRTGALDAACKKVAEIYEEEIDEHLSRFLAVLEPGLVAVLSVIIGAILLSVMLPLLSVMTSLG